MSCVEVGLGITLPTLPNGLTLTPPSFSVSFSADLCCKIAIQIPIHIPIPPLTLNPTILATINTYIGAAQDYLDSFEALHLDCPLD